MPVNTQELLAAVIAASRALPDAATARACPVLGTVRISSADGITRIIGTDLSMLVAATCAGELTGAPVCLPAKPLIAALRGHPRPDVIGVPPDRDGALPITGFPAAGVPAPCPDSVSWAMTGEALAGLLAPVSRVMDSGVYLHVAPDGCLRAVAADGPRLMMTSMPAPEGCTLSNGIILPARAVKTILALKPRGECRVTLSMPDTAAGARLTFAWRGVTLATKLIDAVYPEYERCLPRASESKARLTAPASTLTEAINKVAAGATGRRLVTFDGILVACYDRDDPTESVVLAYATHHGSAVEVRYPSALLLGMLAGEKGAVTLRHGTARGPSRLELPSGAVGVLMPCSV